MTPEQIREVVKITLDELVQRKIIESHKINYSATLQIVEKYLYNFFHSVGNGKSISYALHQLSDDPYIDIIYLYYRDGKTLEWIAEYMDRDVSTIKRNKKRLIAKIYELLEVRL